MRLAKLRPPAKLRLRGRLQPLAKLAFFVVGAPFVARAAWRAWRLERRGDLASTAARLRAVGPFRVAFLRRPLWWVGAADRLLPFVPPWGYGRCLKRSLLLLDLWSRCGLRPRLHLGVRRGGEGAHEAHAWVTVDAVDGVAGPTTETLGYAEAFEL